MDKVALAKINSFASPSMQADFVPPSEEAVFILTSGQLKELIKETIQPLQDEVSQLRATVASQSEKITALESTEEHDISRLALDIAYDRQRLAKLEKSTPGPTDEERIEKLQGYLKDKKSAGLRPETSFTEARTYLEVSRSQFSQLISKLDPRDFVVSPNPLNYKSKLIGLSHKM